ncbi:hypothetical protein [Cyanobium sp. Morenito 9A2]|uniref:hypothetical protein n=1 Tax=Cyanobium sp. Morenito 9A2 TaxID=2823718 RepID=UPI0020CC7C05|nr:hypothetical protein [Cyanobium sp. Morenito 9A2]MCP9849995.1 hypothetical protein [Cyanobium sp. Morenito 9A2]
MTSEQAAALLDDTLDLVHLRLEHLHRRQQGADGRALEAEFREWRHPSGPEIDLVLCPSPS